MNDSVSDMLDHDGSNRVQCFLTSLAPTAAPQHVGMFPRITDCIEVGDVASLRHLTATATESSVPSKAEASVWSSLPSLPIPFLTQNSLAVGVDPSGLGLAVTALLVTVLTLLVHLRIKLKQRHKENYTIVPGLPRVPSPHWHYGHLPQIHCADFRVGQSEVYVRHADENGRSTFWFMNKPAASVLLGPDVKSVLMASSFRAPAPFIRVHQQRLLGRRSLVQLMGREWKHYRNAAHRAFTPIALRDVQGPIEDVGRTLAQSLARSVDSTVTASATMEILPIMKMATIDAFGRIAFGVDLECASRLELTPLAHAFDFLTEEFTRRVSNPNSLVNRMYGLPTPRNVRHGRERATIRQFLDEMVCERREELAKAASTKGNASKDARKSDLLTHLLQANASARDVNNKSASFHRDEKISDEKISDETLSDILMTLLFAGYDTTSVTLTYAVYLLATHPEAEELCVREIETVLSVAAESKSEAGIDIDDLPYTSAVIHETLRLFPPVPTTVRDLERDIKLSHRVTIPAGTQVNIPIWSVQRDERNFPRAEEFLPERWVCRKHGDSWTERDAKEERRRWDQGQQQEEEEKKSDEAETPSTSPIPQVPAADRDAFCTFSGGGRSCLGSKLAIQEAVTILAYLLRDLKFETMSPEYEVVPIVSSVIQKPGDGLPMKISRRR